MKYWDLDHPFVVRSISENTNRKDRVYVHLQLSDDRMSEIRLDLSKSVLDQWSLGSEFDVRLFPKVDE